MAAPAQARYRTIAADSARWDGFAFREGDIVISTPPKCGTTWTQMICALLVFQTPELPAALDELSPWLDMLTRDIDSVKARLAAQTHRRFIKTHTPLDGIPFDEGVTYITVARDPRDVGISWDNHLDNMDLMAFINARAEAVGLDDLEELMAAGPPERAAEAIQRFWGWVDADTALEVADSTLWRTLWHLQTFWDRRDEPNVVLLRYEDMQADLEGVMRGLAASLAIDVPEERWPVLVEAATFESMKSRPQAVAPEVTTSLWLDTSRFFHKGTCGQWRALLDDDDVRRYAARVRSFGYDDVAAWVHEPAL